MHVASNPFILSALCVSIWCVLGVDAIFYHTPSLVVARPEGSASDTNDFGFSIAYQPENRMRDSKNRLIVGAPHSDRVGNVYTCPIEVDLTENLVCNKVDFDDSKFEQYKYDKNQSFYLGASVIATRGYYMACAPLWSSVLHNYTTAATNERNERIRKMEEFEGTFGTCFIFHNNAINRINGLLEQYNFHQQTSGRSKIKINSVYGGLGWSALADEQNQIILLGKPALDGDIHYLYRRHPRKSAKSLHYNGKKTEYQQELIGSTHIGYALAAGRYFTDFSDTVYAFSSQNQNFAGKVNFLRYNGTAIKLLSYQDKMTAVYMELSSDKAGDMFGCALGSANVTAHGRTDLLVGAPAHTEIETSYDVGALYIYLGGDMKTIEEKSRKRVILGEKDGARFGTTIASDDLDNDGLPEIFVSAPFEDSLGALYVLSGYELNETLISSTDYVISLSDLRLTQRIFAKEFQWLGYSLQVLPDLDSNGCNELAIGSPKSARVALLRCIPTIITTISYKDVPGVLKVNDSNFTVQVCIDIKYNTMLPKISTKLSVVNVIALNGNGPKADIKEDSYEMDLSGKPTNYCKKVATVFAREGSGTYIFSTELKSNPYDFLKMNKFDPGWVQLSPRSKTKHSFGVNRACTEKECIPRMNILPVWWNGQNNVTEFRVTSTVNSANLTIVVQNEGPVVNEACLRVRIAGAQVRNNRCALDDSAVVGLYKCLLPERLPQNANYTLNIHLSMSSNDEDLVHIEGLLYDNCHNPNALKNITKDVNILFTHEDIHITGLSHSFNVTDTQLQNKKQFTISDHHQYTIWNNGSINWRGLIVDVTLPAKDYLKQPAISLPDSRCDQWIINDTVNFRCNFILKRRSSVKLTVSIEIEKDEIVNNLVKGKLEIESTVQIYLKPPTTPIYGRQSTTILYVVEMSIGSNKALNIALGIIGALVILGIIIFILYKVGFFKRKEKERLEEVKRRESIKSMKQSTSGSGPGDSSNNKEDMDDLNMEVEEECFQPIECPEGVPDDLVLIEPPKRSKLLSSGSSITK